jgi:hypothetical protein
MGYDLDVGGVDMTIGFDKVGAEYACEKLGRSDWVLFGFYIDSILHGVSGDYNAVVGSGISEILSDSIDCEWNWGEYSRCLNLSLQEYTNRHLGDSLHACLLVPVDFVYADIVLAITS